MHVDPCPGEGNISHVHVLVVILTLVEQTVSDFGLLFFCLLKNSELAVEDFHKYIEILPKSLNEDAMTTYEMIEKRVEKRVESKYDKILAEERQKTKESLRSAAKANKRAEEERIRAEEERVRAEEERIRAEEERIRAEEASARAEEEHKRAENERKRMILRLHKLMQLGPTEIAGITGNEISYIEDVLNNQEEISMDSEETDN